MAALRVIYAPVAALEAVARERRVGLGFGVVALAAVLSLISAAISLIGSSGQIAPQDLQGVPPEVVEGIQTGILIGTPIFAVASQFVWWLVVTLVMQLVTGFFGGRGPLSAMFAVVGIAFVPTVILGIVLIPISGLQVALGSQSVTAALLGLLIWALALAFTVWHVALLVIGASFARNVSYGESSGSCAISCAGCLGMVVLAFVAVFLSSFLSG